MALRRISTLHGALAVSLTVHGALIGWRWADPASFDRLFRATPLEVILVNAKSNERPDKAQAIAQASLAGGGEAAKGRATSPLPPSALTDFGDASEEEVAQKLHTLQEQQTLLLAQVKSQITQATAAAESLREQAQRCREILAKITQLSSSGAPFQVSPHSQPAAAAPAAAPSRRPAQSHAPASSPSR